MIKQLRDNPVFDVLATGRLEQLADGAVRRTLHSREVLFAEGDTASSCYILLAGRVRFSIRLGSRQVTSGFASGSDLFGLESLREGVERFETATAGGPVDLLDIDATVFREFLLHNPRFQLQVLWSVLSRYHEKTCHAVRTGHYDAEQRFAAYLLDNHDGHGREPRQPVSMSQADLADYLALTPETLCRKVGKFRKLGWIEGRGSEYIVRQPAALQQLLNR